MPAELACSFDFFFDLLLLSFSGNGASLAEQQQFAERIDRRTQKMGCELISYDETTASWAFRTEGF